MRIFTKPASIALLAMFAFVMPLNAAKPDKDFNAIKAKVIAPLLNATVDEAVVQRIVETFNVRDSIWPGINYQDLSTTGYEHRQHMSNMYRLAQAYEIKGNKFYKDKNVKKVLDVALAYWVDHNYIHDNWHSNQITNPNTLTNMLLIMGKDMDKTLEPQVFKMAQEGNLNAWGARQSGDRIMIATIQAHWQLYANDVEGFEKTIDVIEREMKIVTGERGMQIDKTFHHRDDGVDNTTSYGNGKYMNCFADWASLTAGTRFAFDESQVKLAIDYYLDGLLPRMVYGAVEGIGIKNRSISSRGSANVNTTGIYDSSVARKLASLTDYRHDELMDNIRYRSGEKLTPKSFAKFFWYGAIFVIQRPNWYSTVRMFSSRNASTEQGYNGNGIQTHFRGDGTNYLSKTGYEHNPIIPYQDWTMIPGTTEPRIPELPQPHSKYLQKFGFNDYAGAVTDGMYGAVGFDFISTLYNVAARKSWFFFDEQYVCLGAGIWCYEDYPVATTVEQVSLNGDVVICDEGGKKTLGRGEHAPATIKWALHNGVGYIFPKEAKVGVLNDECQGSWWDLDHTSTTPKDIVKGDIFKIWIDHGDRSGSSSPRLKGDYQYVVMPYADANSVQKAYDNPDVTILSNTRDLQAVKNEKLGIAYAVLYKAGEIKVNDWFSIGLDTPGIVMVKYSGRDIKEVHVSDPTYANRITNLVINGKRTAVELPSGDMAGSSIKVEL